MVRTLATAVRVKGGKSAKAIKNAVPSTSGLQSSRNSGSIGGNPAAHRETPAWQKPITNFFQKTEAESTSIITLPTSNESFNATEEENLPNILNKETDEEEPQTSDYNKNKSENDKNESEGKSSKSGNKENENRNSNTDNDLQKRKLPTVENDANLLPMKRRKIDYKNLEAIEKFAS